MATHKAVISTEAKHYVWWFPGSPVKVHLDLQVVQRLNQRLRKAGPAAPEEGLLFGNTRDGATEIHDFEPAAGRSVPDMIAALPSGNSRSVIGYYRTEDRETFHLTSKDRLLALESFAKPYQVFLMIQSNRFGSPNATFFFQDRDRQMSDFALLEFPFDSSLLAIEEHDRLQRSQQSAVAVRDVEVPPPAPAATAPATPAVSWRVDFGSVLKSAKWGAALLLVFVLGMIFNNLAFRARVSGVWHAISNPSNTAAPSVSASVVPASSHPSMALRAARQNGDLALTWNRESPIITAATSGAISIQDGEVKRMILLDPAQVRGGSLLYSPTTDQIVMQFTVTTPAESVTESVMVVVPKTGGPQTYPLRVPRATPEPAQAVEKPADTVNPIVTKASKPFVAPIGAKGNQPASLPAIADTPAATSGIRTAAPTAIPGVVLPAPAVPAPVPPGTQELQTRTVSTVSTYEPPVATSKKIPAFPIELQNLTLRRTVVEVLVSIDKNGKVAKADAIPQKEVSQFLLNAAANAARLWKFQPATQNHEPVTSEVVLQFVFTH